MTRLEARFASAAMLFAACTTNPTDPRDANGATSASNVEYDNTTSHLVSSNVQAALDDLAALGTALDARLSAVEPRSPIYCDFTTASLSLPAGSTTPHVFTVSECGGTVPTAAYVGALARLKTCSTNLEGIQVMNAGESDGPGVVLTKAASSLDCSSAGEIAVVFIPR